MTQTFDTPVLSSEVRDGKQWVAVEAQHWHAIHVELSSSFPRFEWLTAVHNLNEDFDVTSMVSTVDLTGSGTLEVGISGNTAAVAAQTAAIAIDAGEIWYGTNPPTVGVLPSQLILSDTNIIQTIGTDTVTAGTLTYYCLWFPITADGSVAAA